MGNRMDTWPMTSRDLESSRSWPNYVFGLISRKRLEIGGVHTYSHNGTLTGNGCSTGYQMVTLTCIDDVMWKQKGLGPTLGLQREERRLVSREIVFRKLQPIRDHDTSTSQRLRDRRTTCYRNTALCVASRCKNQKSVNSVIMFKSSHNITLNNNLITLR